MTDSKKYFSHRTGGCWNALDQHTMDTHLSCRSKSERGLGKVCESTKAGSVKPSITKYLAEQFLRVHGAVEGFKSTWITHHVLNVSKQSWIMDYGKAPENINSCSRGPAGVSCKSSCNKPPPAHNCASLHTCTASTQYAAKFRSQVTASN